MNDIKKLISVVYEISTFNYNSENRPKCLRLILGKDCLDKTVQEYDPKIGNNPIYKKFKYFGLVTKKINRINSSEVKICSMLFNCSEENSFWLLNTLKKADLIQKYIDYLYYKHGLIMLNGEGASSLFKNAFLKNEIQYIMILGENKYTRIIDYLYKSSPNIKILRVTHPSPKNWHINIEKWINCDVLRINPKGDKEANIPLTTQEIFRLNI